MGGSVGGIPEIPILKSDLGDAIDFGVQGDKGPKTLSSVVAKKMNDRRGLLGMLGVLVFWSFGPALSKKAGTPPLVTVFYRMWLALLLHWVLGFAIGHAPSMQTLKRTAAPGLMFAANIVVFFYALQHASVANVSMISALQPVVVLFLAGPLFGERLSRWDVGWTLVALVGASIAVLSSNSAKATTKTSTVGVMLSLGVLFSFTGYFLLSKRASGHTTERAAIHPVTYMAGVLTTATILVTPVCLIVVGPSALGRLSLPNVGWIILIVFVPSMGHLLMSLTHRYVAVSISSLAMLVQPMTASLVAWPINGQPLVAMQAVGALIVIGALGAVIGHRNRAN